MDSLYIYIYMYVYIRPQKGRLFGVQGKPREAYKPEEISFQCLARAEVAQDRGLDLASGQFQGAAKLQKKLHTVFRV